MGEEKNLKMKDIPMLFSDSMVKALRVNRKTMTRRVIKPPCNCAFCTGFVIDAAAPHNLVWMCDATGTHPLKTIYTPGRQIWVRETWANINKPGIAPEYIYRADYDRAELAEYKNDGGTWRPSIFMPREA